MVMDGKKKRAKKSSRKRNSRMKCPDCGGSLSVDDNKMKTPHMMIRYRPCESCGERWVGTETLRKKAENDPEF